MYLLHNLKPESGQPDRQRVSNYFQAPLNEQRCSFFAIHNKSSRKQHPPNAQIIYRCWQAIQACVLHVRTEKAPMLFQSANTSQFFRLPDNTKQNHLFMASETLRLCWYQCYKNAAIIDAFV